MDGPCSIDLIRKFYEIPQNMKNAVISNNYNLASCVNSHVLHNNDNVKKIMTKLETLLTNLKEKKTKVETALNDLSSLRGSNVTRLIEIARRAIDRANKVEYAYNIINDLKSLPEQIALYRPPTIAYEDEYEERHIEPPPYGRGAGPWRLYNARQIRIAEARAISRTSLIKSFPYGLIKNIPQIKSTSENVKSYTHKIGKSLYSKVGSLLRDANLYISSKIRKGVNALKRQNDFPRYNALYVNGDLNNALNVNEPLNIGDKLTHGIGNFSKVPLGDRKPLHQSFRRSTLRGRPIYFKKQLLNRGVTFKHKPLAVVNEGPPPFQPYENMTPEEQDENDREQAEIQEAINALHSKAPEKLIEPINTSQNPKSSFKLPWQEDWNRVINRATSAREYEYNYYQALREARAPEPIKFENTPEFKQLAENARNMLKSNMSPEKKAQIKEDIEHELLMLQYQLLRKRNTIFPELPLNHEEVELNRKYDILDNNLKEFEYVYKDFIDNYDIYLITYRASLGNLVPNFTTEMDKRVLEKQTKKGGYTRRLR